jgi:putative membrane protein
VAAPQNTDIRFSLANERTFLAYERTAVGLVAAALAVFHLLEPSWPQKLLGLLLVASAVIAAGGGWLRYRQAERAIREGRDLPAGTTVHLMAAAVLVVIVAAGISVVV